MGDRGTTGRSHRRDAKGSSRTGMAGRARSVGQDWGVGRVAKPKGRRRHIDPERSRQVHWMLEDSGAVGVDDSEKKTRGGIARLEIIGLLLETPKSTHECSCASSILRFAALGRNSWRDTNIRQRKDKQGEVKVNSRRRLGARWCNEFETSDVLGRQISESAVHSNLSLI